MERSVENYDPSFEIQKYHTAVNKVLGNAI